MTIRLMIAYSLMSILVLMAAGGIFYLRHNSRQRKIRRHYAARDRERGDDVRRQAHEPSGPE